MPTPPSSIAAIVDSSGIGSVSSPARLVQRRSEANISWFE
jgi:hypothetical protein